MPLRPSYKPLRHLLIERNMTLADLRKSTPVSRNTFTSINHDRFVSLETIAHICEALNCRIENVVEFVPE
ncbi:helix-turn-helix domain-containing protein [Paenibacillus sp. FSL M7-1455]|uniref:helix-turn-helix domain-containing protein n=1 Tax=Paenibacillus sp. FSL M7-1455 TaxID=2975316 RepID=UPI00404094D0